MARLTWADVRNGKAIPQIGDIVGDLRYKGGDPSDLSRYQPLDGSTPRTGSICDPDDTNPDVAANAASAGQIIPDSSALPGQSFSPTF
jgi:hypothetical protein